jgi:hypothetical protein
VVEAGVGEFVEPLRGLFVRPSRSTASSLGSKEPRIVAFEQYGRGLEGLAQRKPAGAPEGRATPLFSPHPNSSWASRRGAASLLVPVAAGPPSSLEPIIRLEVMIDARIDKALARLVGLQEYERVRATYSPPLIAV